VTVDPPLHLTASATELIARTVCPMAYVRAWSNLYRLTILELCRTEGAMVMVHAESDGMIKWITSRLLDAELRTPKYHGVARHALAEREATHRAITFAEFVGVCKSTLPDCEV
jgi:dihydroorotase-like cyclic amidohydrolase